MFCGTNKLVPQHFGSQYIVVFRDDTHATVLYRFHDHHAYYDDETTYKGWGYYVDDYVKCDDGVWRIQTIRLAYRKIEGVLRYTGPVDEE